MKIGIVGYGFVGKALNLLKCDQIEVMVYDIVSELCQPKNIELKDLVTCDFIFLCLPTPQDVDGSSYTKYVETTINKLHALDYKNIIIRSTVPISFCNKYGVIHMPEFLTERNWEKDFINNSHWVFGVDKCCLESVGQLKVLIQTAHKHGRIKSDACHFITTKESEFLKFVLNSYLASKVGFFNEMYEIAQAYGINYDNVVEMVKLDERVGDTHLTIPGPDGKFGYGGTCFPKDTNALYRMMCENSVKSYYLQSGIDRNENYDRKCREWLDSAHINRTAIHVDKKVILVTGGAGFIGSNLCKQLVKDKSCFVVCLDNLYSGLLENIKQLEEMDNFIFVKHDITKKMFFPKIDEIYHLACPASPVFYQNEPIKTIKTCVKGTLNILKLCKVHRCKMLFTSTSEVYGDPKINPQHEEYWGNVNPVGIRSNYDESKRVCETMIFEYRRKYGLDLKIVRIFNTYGPGMRLDDGRIITNFINSLKNSKPLTIYGTGSQTRSMCFISDMLDGLTKMMDSDQHGPINLGNPDGEFTINEIADIFEKVVGKRIERIHMDLPKDDPKVRKPDITLAQLHLKWAPKVSTYEGIKIMLDHYLTLDSALNTNLDQTD